MVDEYGASDANRTVRNDDAAAAADDELCLEGGNFP